MTTTKTIKQLVELHNELNPNAPLTQWKGKKVDLIARIDAIKPARTVRECAQEHLGKVDHYDDETSVGLSYKDVLAAVKEEFPSCETTVGCLRWYAAKMRSKDSSAVPQRRLKAS